MPTPGPDAPHHQQLEYEFAQWHTSKLDPFSMVACSSGTAALHLALESLRLPANSYVIVPDYAMIAIPRAVSLAGLTPIFCDVNPRTYNLDAVRLTKLIHTLPDDTLDRVCAVIPVHTYGRACEMRDLLHLCKQRGWKVIEDLAEAHGIAPHPDSDAACWSFYRNKIIAGEEGGMVYLSDPGQAATTKRLRSLGFLSGADGYHHTPRGHNYRLAPTLAHIIRGSLQNYPENYTQRRTVEADYLRCFPDQWTTPWRDAPWVFDLRIPGMTWEQQAQIVRTLNTLSPDMPKVIQARPGFYPLHLQPEYRDCIGPTPIPYPAGNSSAAIQAARSEDTEPYSVQISREVLYVPLTPSLFPREIERVCRVIVDTLSPALE